jgi:hypothetical protein
MSDKIIFNGREFDGIEAMPADLRKQYEDVLRLLADSGQAAADGKGAIRKIVKTSVRTAIVVNQKEYKSLDELPPELRAEYARAVGSGGTGGDGLSPVALTPGRRPGVTLPTRQILLILLGALFFAWWVMHRR